jgi:hypothetical protein
MILRRLIDSTGECSAFSDSSSLEGLSLDCSDSSSLEALSASFSDLCSLVDLLLISAPSLSLVGGSVRRLGDFFVGA